MKDSAVAIPEFLEKRLGSLVPIGYGLSAGVVSITPAVAEELLQFCNKKNRNKKTVHISRIEADIRSGRWALNGESIIFDERGVLLNGQHRLEAIASAGVAIVSVVIAGVREESMESIDQGISRTTGDVLAIEGCQNSNSMAAAASWMWKYQHGNLYNTSLRPSRAQVIDLIVQQPDVCESVQWAASAMRGVGGGSSIHAFLRCVFMRIDRANGEEFYNKLSTGAGLDGSSPILALRNRLMDRSNRFVVQEYVELTIRAWNYYRTGVTGAKLKLSGRDVIPEPI